MTAMRARFRAFQHGQQSQDMTGSACRFWRGLCVRAGSMLARRVSQVLWSTPCGSQARVKPKAQAAGEAGLVHLRTQELESCAPVADTFGLSFLRGGPREAETGPALPLDPKAGPLTTGIWGCLRVVDGNAGTVELSSTDNSRTRIVCSRFWRGLCVRAGSLLARRGEGPRLRRPA